MERLGALPWDSAERQSYRRSRPPHVCSESTKGGCSVPRLLRLLSQPQNLETVVVSPAEKAVSAARCNRHSLAASRELAERISSAPRNRHPRGR